MAVLVSYTPVSSMHNSRVQERIRNYARWAIFNPYTFIVDNEEMGTLSSRAVRDDLATICTDGDQLIVLQVSRPAATICRERTNSWLRNNLPAPPSQR